MPKVGWGVNAREVDEYEPMYQEYVGPPVPTGVVYRWRVKVLQHAPATAEKLPQIRVGLEIVPRSKAERRYKGFFVMAFLNVSERTNFVYVPFLQAIGVTGREFTRGTITDEEGNIRKIGHWRMDGTAELMARLDPTDMDKGAKRPYKIGWIGALPEEVEEEDDDEIDDDDVFDDDGEYDVEVEEDDDDDFDDGDL